jgi:protein transport protein HofC
VALLIALRLIYPEGPRPGDTIYLPQRVAGVVLLAIGMLGFFVELASFLGVLFWIAALVIWAMSVGRYRAMQRQAAMELLALSADKSMPLGPGLAALAREQGGPVGRRLAALAAKLDRGQPLAAAIEQTPRALPRFAGLAAMIGQQTGAVGPALREAALSPGIHRPVWQAAGGRLFYYWFLLSIWGPIIVIFMTVRLAPSFQKIFADFGSELPQLTQYVFGLARSGIWALVATLILQIGFVALAWMTLNYIGWIDVGLPGTHRLLRRLDAGVILRALALAAEREGSLVDTLTTLATTYPKWSIRSRLRRAAADVVGGRAWQESLLARGLIRSADAAVLEAAERAGNLAWALREMAQSNERRLVYRLEVLIQLLSPLVVLGVGALVALFVVGYFLPLAKLIEDLS